MIVTNPEPVEYEDKPVADAMDLVKDGEGEEVGSVEELDPVHNLRLYLDLEIELDSEYERVMGRAIRVIRECIRGFLLRFVS